MILRRIARPLLAAIFVSGGINALRQLEGHAEAARPWLDKTIGKNADRLPEQVPTDAKTLVQIDAAVKIGAGAALAFGKAPRLAALVLFGSVVPTTLAAHPFWEEDDPAQRDAQLVHFLKNCGLAGGLLLAAADTHGKPSVTWWARHEMGEAGRWAIAANAAARRQGKRSLSQAKHGAKHAKHGVKRTRLGAEKARKGGMSRAQGGMLKGIGKGMGKAGQVRKAKKGGDLRKAQDGLRQMQQDAMRKAQESMRQAQAGARRARASARKVQAGGRKAQHDGAMQRVQHGAKQAQRTTQARVALARAEAQARAARTHTRQARGHAKKAVAH